MNDLTQLQVRIEDFVATMTLNAPPVNALTRTLNDELTLALDRISEMDEVRAVVLTGAGKVFCAGADLKGFEAAPVNYISVPAATPPAIIERLNREINAVLQSPEVKAQLASHGVIPQGSTPAQMAALVRSEAAQWKKVIQFSGARLD